MKKLRRILTQIRSAYQALPNKLWARRIKLLLRRAFRRTLEIARRLRDRARGEDDPIGTGVDVSMHQGDVDWDQVATEHDFAGVKATEGVDYVDPFFTAGRLRAMARAGLRILAYHFARPDSDHPRRGIADPRREARDFVAAVQGAGGEFISAREWKRGKRGVLGVLDFESRPFSEAWAREWGREYRRLTGHKAVIYGYGESLNTILGVLDEFAFIWIAAYTEDWRPYFKGREGRVRIWQHTSVGRCPGIKGDVDLNRWVDRPRKQREPDEPRPKDIPSWLPPRFAKQWREPWTVGAHSSAEPEFKRLLWQHGLLSPNFSRREAASKDGTSIPARLRNKAQFHAFRLERVRHRLGDKPMSALSWYRSPDHNEDVGGVDGSEHLEAWATDWDDAERSRLGGERFDREMEREFATGGIGFRNGRVSHVDNGPARTWVYT